MTTPNPLAGLKKPPDPIQERIAITQDRIAKALERIADRLEYDGVCKECKGEGDH